MHEGDYVGNTKKGIKQTISKHKQTVKHVDTNSGLVVHVAQTGHDND